MKVFTNAILTIFAGVLIAACGNYAGSKTASSAPTLNRNLPADSRPSAKQETKSKANAAVDDKQEESPKNSPNTTSNSNQTTKVKVFLIRLNDGSNWENKEAIGCGDLLVPVTRTIKPTAAPLRAAINELLSPLKDLDTKKLELENFWKGDGLKIKSLVLKDGVATIHITGNLSVAGICDEPRIISQINMTATQFPTVDKADVFLNGTPLEEAISDGS
jgi:spore germination protein GerM